MTHKKVLVADRIAKEGIDVLRDKGYDVDVKLDLTEDELAAQIAPYDAIVVRSATPVTSASAAPRSSAGPLSPSSTSRSR